MKDINQIYNEAKKFVEKVFPTPTTSTNNQRISILSIMRMLIDIEKMKVEEEKSIEYVELFFKTLEELKSKEPQPPLSKTSIKKE